jgi:hypothetical protein
MDLGDRCHSQGPPRYSQVWLRVRRLRIEYGYRLCLDGVHIEPDPAEQAALAAIRKLRLGGQSLRAVAGVLNESGHRTRRGTEWRLESVVRAINQDAENVQLPMA